MLAQRRLSDQTLSRRGVHHRLPGRGGEKHQLVLLLPLPAAGHVLRGVGVDHVCVHIAGDERRSPSSGCTGAVALAVPVWTFA
eukprot:3363606-Pyramimonas_sp.AAC.1